MSMIKSNRSNPSMNPLDQRIPRNPKYENVQSTLDTGNSLTKFLKQHEDLRGSSKQQAGEMFKRMKVTTLVQLIIQVAEIDTLDTPKNTEFDPTASQRKFTNTDRSQRQDSQNLDTTRSTLESLLHGVGEVDAYRNYQKYFSSSSKTSFSEQVDSEPNDRPYLIVDLRDNDAFKTNHIISAHHYPAAMLSRCTNYESKELLIYKNQSGKIIIIYDEDERIGFQAATIMVERGYNNIFLLSGGLRHAVRKFPRGLLTGACPLSWTLPNTPHSPTTKPKRLQLKSSSFNHPATSKRPPQGPMVTFHSHEQFTNHDIEELNTQLEKNLIPNDSGTRLSRLTTSKQGSRSSINSHRSSMSNISDKPWKP